MSFCDNSTDCVSGVQTDSDSFILLCLLQEKIGVLEVSHFTHTHFPSGFHLHRLMGAEEVTKMTPISLTWCMCV